MSNIEVNGNKYRRREREVNKTNKKGFAMMAMTMALSGGVEFGSSYERKRPKVDIVEEFAKIQRKESLLSRNDRDWVEYCFNYEYELIHE